jgi:hypothetical protein
MSAPQRSHVILSSMGSEGGLRMADTIGVMNGFFSGSTGTLGIVARGSSDDRGAPASVAMDSEGRTLPNLRSAVRLVGQPADKEQ